MLKQLRGWFHSLKFMLWVVVAGFIFTMFTVWGNVRETGRSGPGAPWAARIDGDTIPAKILMQRARNLDRFYRQLYGDSYTQQRPLLRLGETVIGDLIDNHLIATEARQLGLGATTTDLTKLVTSLPDYRGPDGRFIGREAYESAVRARGFDLVSYESELLESISVERMKNSIFDAVWVSERELDEELRRRHEKTRVALLRAPAAQFEPSEAAQEVKLQAHLELHPDRFRLGERRRGRFLILPRDAVAGQIEISEADIRRLYERGRDTRYTRREQRQATHILFRIDSAATEEQIEAVRKKAAKVLEEARGGADFEALARTHSEDPGSALRGGDLGFFERGAMVPAFENEAFRLPIGEISDLVRSPYGYHIIKVTGAQPPGTVPFEEARAGIELSIHFERVQEEMTRQARTWTERLRAGDSLEKIAAEEALEIQDTGLLAREERGGGATGVMVGALFTLEPGSPSEPLPVPEGLAVLQLVEVRPPSVPALEEVREQVEVDWRREQALGGARRGLEAAGCYASQAPAAADLAGNLSAETLELGPFARTDPPAELPSSLRQAAFTIPVGGWSEPSLEADDIVALQVLERPPLDEDILTSGREGLRRTLLFEKRNRLYTELTARLRERATIELNEPLIEQINGR